jgi:hypothetical protein
LIAILDRIHLYEYIDIFHVVRKWNVEMQVETSEMSRLATRRKRKCLPHRRALAEEGAVARAQPMLETSKKLSKAKAQIRDF